jgi:hypothetical protein
MMTYVEVDGVIDARVRVTGSTLFTEWAGQVARYFHIPGDPPFECFQVSVRLPENGQTAVTVRAIDTNDDTEDELDQTWEGSIGDLDGMLGAALAAIDGWKVRERVRPDPSSPW